MSRKNKSQTEKNEQPLNVPGRFSYAGLERVIHEKARLGILSSLAVHKEGLLFNDLKEACSLTDGNLSRHLAVLNEAGLVEAWKGQQGSRTHTLYRLTSEGRFQFGEYINLLEKIVAEARVEVQSQDIQQLRSEGWSPT